VVREVTRDPDPSLRLTRFGRRAVASRAARASRWPPEGRMKVHQGIPSEPVLMGNPLLGRLGTPGAGDWPGAGAPSASARG
jgi:hypothetical protein